MSKVEMRLDGKVIGTFDGEQGKLNPPPGDSPPAEDGRPNISVPLVNFTRPSEEGNTQNQNDQTGDEQGDEGNDQGVDFEKLPDEVKEFIAHQMLTQESNNQTIGRLQQQLDELLAQRNTKSEDELVAGIDAIKDIPEDKDPFGIARTMKNIAREVAKIKLSMGQSDQRTRYTEARRALDAAKDTPEAKKIFGHPTIGPIAENLLTHELNTQKGVPIGQLVSKVVKAVHTLQPSLALKQKVDKVGKVPQTLRASDGSSPALTVKRPGNLKQASEAYQAWRRASNRHHQGG